MPESGAKKRLALDANLPLDLASGADFALEFCDDFRARGYQLYLPPTAAEEIWLIHQNSTHPKRRLASKALRQLTSWSIELLELGLERSLVRTVGRAFAQRLIFAGHLPEQEVNDGMILAEAALGEIPVLVTRDHHLAQY